jgi:predicted metal-binding protein
MLQRVDSGPALVVCTTCRLSSTGREDRTGRRGGALFADQLRTQLAAHPCNGRLDLQEMRCLFACSTFCTVQLRCAGKIGYVLGRFSPTPQDARALLDYAARYIESAEGIVPYEHWPEGVKNHFIVRTPPEGFTWQP